MNRGYVQNEATSDMIIEVLCSFSFPLVFDIDRHCCTHSDEPTSDNDDLN